MNDIFKEGYGTLVARMGASLPVRLNTPATGVLDKVTLQFDGERFGLTPNQWLTF